MPNISGHVEFSFFHVKKMVLCGEKKNPSDLYGLLVSVYYALGILLPLLPTYNLSMCLPFRRLKIDSGFSSHYPIESNGTEDGSP